MLGWPSWFFPELLQTLFIFDPQGGPPTSSALGWEYTLIWGRMLLLLGSKVPCTCVRGNLFSSGWIRWPSCWRTISTMVSALVFQSVFISCLIYLFCPHWEASSLFFQDEVSIWTLPLCFLWSQLQISVSLIAGLETSTERGLDSMVLSQMSSAYLLSVAGF